MSEEKGPAGELAAGIQTILGRVGDFFHIFDLSFFVAGASTCGALTVLYFAVAKPIKFPFAPWVGVAAVILACYICGLLAYAVGRALNNVLFRRDILRPTLEKELNAHGLDKLQGIAAYLPDSKQEYDALHVRMWSEVAHDRPPVLSLLQRYWVMAATYDAVGVSLFVWAVVLIVAACSGIAVKALNARLAVGAAMACAAAAFFALHRGAEFYKYQVVELVAHFAVTRGHLVTKAE